MPIIILGLISLCLVAYKSINVVIEQELSNSMLMSVQKSAESINRWLETIMLEPETMASTPAAKRINEDFHRLDLQNINRYKILHEKYPHIFQDIYGANRRGEYHTVLLNGDEPSLFVGDIANRPYFRSIMAGGPTQITPPLISRTTGIPTIFIVSPILDEDKKPLGIVGAGISLKYIQQIAQELKAGKTGYGFIVSPNGTYVYHPQPDFIMKKKIALHEVSSVSSLGNLMVSGGSGIYRYMENNQRMVAFYEPIPIANWSVAKVLPEVELFAPATKMMRLLILVTIGFVCLIAAAIFIAMQRQTRPIQTLAARTQQIAAGNFKGPDLEVKSNDEIGILSKSFNEMVASLETEKKAVKMLIDQLKESEALFRSQFEFGNIGIGIAQDNAWIRVNDRLCSMLGYSQEDLIGMAWPGASHFQGQADDLQHYKRMIEGQIDRYEIEEQYQHKDGHAVFTHVNVSCFRNPDRSVQFVIASFLDISKRRAAEKDLVKAKTYIGSIIDSMPSIIVGVDHGLKITQWNKAAADKTGISASDAKTQNLTDVFPISSIDAKTIIQSIEKREVEHLSKVHYTSGDESAYYDITVYPLIIDEYEVEDVVIRIDDVSEKVKIEEILIQNEKMLSVGGLAAGMAHEINNPLAGVIQNTHVLSNRLTNPDIPANIKAAQSLGITMESILKYLTAREIPRMIKAITESGLRMASIVENMLSFARKGDFSFSSHHPAELMDKTLELASTDYDLKKQYDFKSIIIKKEYEDNLPMIVCEGSKIQQVLLNLLNNGTHAMFDQERSENRPAPQFIIRLSHKIETGMLQIEIEDNGVGIDDQIQKDIFEPFFTTKPVGKGTGLGLSVSYFIITENHKGSIDVFSKPGWGTKFTISLPVIEKEPQSEIDEKL